MKRILDLSLSILAAFALAPVLVITAVLVRHRLGSPVFFRQLRTGLHGNRFHLIKFRTMTQSVDSAGCTLPDSERLTPFGLWLRNSSLDELPQLWSVIKGDMSLVGPRPLLPQYLDRYTPRQRRRLEVTPGITGWAQVHGRNALSWEERFELDVWYVDHRSLLLDLRILGMTLTSVLRRTGVSPGGQATMPEFLGHGGPQFHK